LNRKEYKIKRLNKSKVIKISKSKQKKLKKKNRKEKGNITGFPQDRRTTRGK
jgi:hypothetical protein